MKTIAFWNRKGGTGKTTTAGNVAAELHRRANVLIIDCDPQANLSSWLAPSEFEHELADVLSGKCKLHEAVEPVRDGWHILPTFAIGGDLREYVDMKLPGQPFAFQELIDQAREDGYHYVLLDLAPGDSVLEQSALGVCDEVVLVVSPERFAVDGITSALDTLEQVRRNRRGKFTVERMVVNRINGAYTAHQLYQDALVKTEWNTYAIRQSTAVHDALFSAQTIGEYAPGDRNTSEYLRLATELV